MKKFISVIISVFLALSTALLLPVQVFAKQPTYIKDVIICTGSSVDDASAKVTAKGYTPIKHDLNKGNGTVVVMGYISTDNKSEAITDLAAMTEKSGYSFAQYKEMLKEKEQTVSDLVNKFKVAIDEFRENYEAEEPSTLIAYEMLNYLTNDDMNDMGIGDMLISEETTDEQLKVVFMQTRTEFLASIEENLALGCASNSWFEKLSDADTDGAYEPSVADDARCIYNTLEAFQKNMNKFLELGIDENTSEDEITEFLNTCTEAEKTRFLTYYSTFRLLKETTYLERNLFDLLMSDLNNLDMALLYPMASLMSPGQLATFEFVPFATSVTNNVMTQENWEQYAEDIKNVDGYNSLEKVSVFSGVDRTIYNPEGIAVTSQALLHQNATSESIIDTEPLIPNAKNVVTVLALVCITTALATAALFANKSALTLYFTTKAMSAYDFHCYLWYDYYSAFQSCYSSIFTTIANITLGITIAVLLILTAILLINKFVSSNKHPKYSEMPRIIVDIDVTKSEEYVYYYCAKDESGNLADVNAWNGEKWTGIYYTKDTDAGKPLTVESLVNYGLENNAAPTSADTSYRGVHYFGETAAYNLNRNSNYKKTVAQSDYVYMYFVEDTSVQTASVFSGKTGYALAGFGGLVIGAVISALIPKGKKKKAEAAA